MGPGRDQTHDHWISSQTRICCPKRYRALKCVDLIKMFLCNGALYVLGRIFDASKMHLIPAVGSIAVVLFLA